ncbi:hypothetical protein NQ318_011838 [Aromia moschata]|uniref:Uncharacterized protein n=1 Tax=Aromia moschata TaxID=1265417 RepID=A0AAV8XFW0_9CUCU|nr:hypothetical protein NQ318_011838 [Aromia moschata]
MFPCTNGGIHFSGDHHDKQGLSVNAFIERAEDLRLSLGVSEEELKNSVTDLIKGNALVWHRSSETPSRLRNRSLVVDLEVYNHRFLSKCSLPRDGLMGTFCKTQKIVDNKSFNTANKVIDSAADLNDVFYVFVDLMTTQMSEFQKRDSGWELQFIMYVEINLNKFCAFGGSSYMKLPSFIERRKEL